MPEEVLSDLHNGLFIKNEDPDSFKRNIQSFYVDALIGAFTDDSDYDEISKAAIFESLLKIKDFTKGNFRNAETRSHFQYLNWKVSNFIDGKVFTLLEDK